MNETNFFYDETFERGQKVFVRASNEKIKFHFKISTDKKIYSVAPHIYSIYNDIYGV